MIGVVIGIILFGVLGLFYLWMCYRVESAIRDITDVKTEKEEKKT